MNLWIPVIVGGCVFDAQTLTCIHCSRPAKRFTNRHCHKSPATFLFLQRLAEETQHPEILDQPDRYRQAVIQWAAAGFPVRDVTDQARIRDKLCPDCPHYALATKKCGRCGAKGQLVAALAHMATSPCPDGTWAEW